MKAYPIYRVGIILLVLLMLSSCINDDEWFELNNPLEVNITTTGLFIVNEGNFMYDNASLSYYDIDSMKVLNQVFYRTNEVLLGDVAFSMMIRDSLGYIIVNNSGKIYVINVNTFDYVGKITGLSSPRHIHFINDTKAYVTDLYAKSISIVDLINLEVTGSIDVSNNASEFYQHPTEEMVQYGKYVFTNCWSYDNKILVIDSETDRLVDSIEVVTQPVSIALDKYNKLWVLSDGGFEGSAYGFEEPALTRIDAESRIIEEVIRFDTDDSPSELCINGRRDTLYYLNKHIFILPVLSTDDPQVLISSPYQESHSRGYFGLAADPNSSEIYIADAIDFVQQGAVYRFSANGTPVDTFSVGISPGGFCFKP